MDKTSNIAIEETQRILSQISNAISSIVLGKQQQIQLALTCLLANGHLLIEDLPGVGKTTLALTMARVFGLDFHRIQFTSDLLPADVLGISVYNANNNQFDFHQGPVFTQVLLADEINRATPKTQSALLEAMEERQVTQDGVTRVLPEPFLSLPHRIQLNRLVHFPCPNHSLIDF